MSGIPKWAIVSGAVAIIVGAGLGVATNAAIQHRSVEQPIVAEGATEHATTGWCTDVTFAGTVTGVVDHPIIPLPGRSARIVVNTIDGAVLTITPVPNCGSGGDAPTIDDAQATVVVALAGCVVDLEQGATAVREQSPSCVLYAHDYDFGASTPGLVWSVQWSSLKVGAQSGWQGSGDPLCLDVDVAVRIRTGATSVYNASDPMTVCLDGR